MRKGCREFHADAELGDVGTLQDIVTEMLSVRAKNKQLLLLTKGFSQAACIKKVTSTSLDMRAYAACNLAICFLASIDELQQSIDDQRTVSTSLSYQA